MNIADRVQETTSATDTTTVALLGATTGNRTAAAAFAVGATGIPFIVDDGAGNWQLASYTLTNSTTLTRETIMSSNGALGAGTKNVSCVASADLMQRGLTNPDDAGFDIILCAGQSNMAGRGALDTMVDIADARVWQFGGASGDARYRTIFSGVDPLHMAEGVNTGQVGPATAFARAYASMIPTNRRVLLVPCAVGGTAMVGGTTPPWAPGSPGGTLYENAIAQANLAVTAAQTLFPGSRVVGTIWHQGESDGDNNVTQANYAAALKALIAGFRARITAAANSWFVIGGMCPEVIASFASYTPIDLAHKQVANETSKCAFVAGPTGFRADTWHYTAPGARILGARMALAVRAASTYVGVVPVATAVTLSGPSGGIVSTASTSFTVGVSPVGGTVSGTVTVTPTDGGAGGTFTPTTVSLTTAAPNKTFTYTPAATGAKTISISNNGGLTNPSGVSYTVSAAATAPATMGAPVATGGNASASVVLTAPADGGSAITGYTVTSNPAGGVDANAGTTVLTHSITGLANGTAYTFTATATNTVGTSAPSPASNSVTPAVPTATFATFSPTDKNSTFTLSNNNLTATNSGAASWSSARANTGKSSGKWYWETTHTGANRVVIGIGTATESLTSFPGSTDANGWGYYTAGGIYNSGGFVGGGTYAAFAAGDVIGIALDMDAKTIRFYKNGVAQGSAALTGLPAGPMYPMVASEGAGYAITANFGATAFANTPPAGFVGLQ